MLLYVIICGVGLMIVGMIIVWIRNDQSWLSSLIPGVNYYMRTRIAQWPFGLSVITACINMGLLLILGYQRYTNTNLGATNSIFDIIRQYLIAFPSIVHNNFIIVGLILLLQIRVNWGVAHRQGRGLLSGIELTLFAPVFWLVLALTNKKTSEESEEKYIH